MVYASEYLYGKFTSVAPLRQKNLANIAKLYFWYFGVWQISDIYDYLIFRLASIVNFCDKYTMISS